VFVEYAKADTEDILIKITAANRGPETANLRLLPTVWFRNTWSWGGRDRQPNLCEAQIAPNPSIELHLPRRRKDQPANRWLHLRRLSELLFTRTRLTSGGFSELSNRAPYVKDGINDYVVNGVKAAVNPEHLGTKAAAHYRLTVCGGETVVVRLRLTNSNFKAQMHLKVSM